MKQIKAKIGDILRLNYVNSKHDPKPMIVYMATVLAQNGHRIISGFNLNYVRSLKEQNSLIEYVRKYSNALEAYKSIKVNHPKWIKSFRTYIQTDVKTAYRLNDKNFKLEKLR